jgi:8-oxo-dGTP pyrophosphatase MutT (NUDIX family)
MPGELRPDLGTPSPSRPLRIAVAALLRPGPGGPEVLIAKRRATAIRGGLWELPGGKVDAGEPVTAAAARELLEETGVAVDPAGGVTLGTVRQTDEGLAREASLELTLVRFDAPPGAEPRPLASAECRWERVDRLDRYEWPAANAALNTMLAAHAAGA